MASSLRGAVAMKQSIDRTETVEHDPEKWIPVFRNDHAPLKIYSAMTIQPNANALY
jgi:hypothetical protein